MSKERMARIDGDKISWTVSVSNETIEGIKRGMEHPKDVIEKMVDRVSSQVYSEFHEWLQDRFGL